MEFEQILALIDRVSNSGLTSFRYEEGECKLSMERENPRAAEGGYVTPATVSVASSGSEPASVRPEPETGEEKQEGNLVKSLLVGTFYAAPAEDAEPFVKPGDRVVKGQVLAIVEAMKLMNEVESDYDGEIAEIFVKNGEAVEYGQPLFRII